MLQNYTWHLRANNAIRYFNHCTRPSQTQRIHDCMSTVTALCLRYQYRRKLTNVANKWTSDLIQSKKHYKLQLFRYWQFSGIIYSIYRQHDIAGLQTIILIVIRHGKDITVNNAEKFIQTLC